MTIDEAFQVTSIIEKFPPTLKDFKNYLKRKRKEISFENLIMILRIKEDKCHVDKRGSSHIKVKANIVKTSKLKKKKIDKAFSSRLNPKGRISKK